MNCKIVALVVLLTIVLSLKASPAPDPNYHQLIVNSISDIENDIHHWNRAGSLELSSVVLIGIIGLVVTGLQTVQGWWGKAVTAVLGILSGGLLLVNQN